MLAKKIWISSTICSALFFAFSSIEYYKYNVSGSHFLISDLALTKNVTDVATFAKLSFNLPLVIIAFLLALYSFFFWIFKVEITYERPVRFAASLGIFVMLSLSIITPYFYTVCNASGVDSEYTQNAFQESKRFNKNSLTANLVVNFNQLLMSRPKMPDDYSKDAVEAIIETTVPDNAENKPNINVIVILSESFADFRDLLSYYDPDGKVKLPDDIYSEYDEVLSQSTVGECIVPTFGGGTVRSEFELIFGLPMEAMGNPSVPLSVFDKGKKYISIPSLFRDSGYSTSYVHPFSKSFYDRVDYYENFGFDKLIFDEDMKVFLSPELFRMGKDEGITPIGYYHNFISDVAALGEVYSRMEYTDGPDYIQLTTMQNHMPYGNDSNEQDNYLAGIKSSASALKNFIEKLKKFDEPTIVLYMGDHYPFFSNLDSIYEHIGITENNYDMLYRQKYLIWNNFDLQINKEPTISAFYLPCLLAQYAGVDGSFTKAVLSQKSLCPIYSPVIANQGTEVLKLLTYDRISGKGFSD